MMIGKQLQAAVELVHQANVNLQNASCAEQTKSTGLHQSSLLVVTAASTLRFLRGSLCMPGV